MFGRRPCAGLTLCWKSVRSLVITLSEIAREAFRRASSRSWQIDRELALCCFCCFLKRLTFRWFLWCLVVSRRYFGLSLWRSLLFFIINLFNTLWRLFFHFTPILAVLYCESPRMDVARRVVQSHSVQICDGLLSNHRDCKWTLCNQRALLAVWLC